MNDSIFVEYHELIKSDYIDYVSKTFQRMVDDLGPSLKDVYNSWDWAVRFKTCIRQNVINTPDEGSRQDKNYKIDPVALERNAIYYADLAIGTLRAKINRKVGEFDSHDEPYLSDSRVFINGIINGHSVQLRQSIIVNVSKRGVLFNQFPMRLTVDGKRMSEAEFKGLKHEGLE